MFAGTGEVAGAARWNVKDQKAYGICISLYEQHPVNGKMSGIYCKNQKNSEIQTAVIILKF